MIEQEQLLIDKFYENDNDFIYAPDGEILWTDYKSAREFLNVHPELFCYTSVETDNGQIWLIEGYHYVNRLGYIITTRNMNIPEEGLREL